MNIQRIASRAADSGNANSVKRLSQPSGLPVQKIVPDTHAGFGACAEAQHGLSLLTARLRAPSQRCAGRGQQPRPRRARVQRLQPHTARLLPYKQEGRALATTHGAAAGARAGSRARACSSSSVMLSPSSLATRLRFLNEILPVSSSSNRRKALRISSLLSRSPILVVIMPRKSSKSMVPEPSLSMSAIIFFTSSFLGSKPSALRARTA